MTQVCCSHVHCASARLLCAARGRLPNQHKAHTFVGEKNILGRPVLRDEDLCCGRGTFSCVCVSTVLPTRCWEWHGCVLLVSAAMLSKFTHEVAPPSVAQVFTIAFSSKSTGTSGLSSSRPPRCLFPARALSRTLSPSSAFSERRGAGTHRLSKFKSARASLRSWVNEST